MSSNDSLTDKEKSMFITLYGDAPADDGTHSRLAKLFLTSMAPGTVIILRTTPTQTCVIMDGLDNFVCCFRGKMG